MNYYNEHDPKAAAWLRELITQGLIPPGHVDTRSISEIQPHDLSAYTQCHFFAGIGGWSLALRLAGWPTDRPVWTGSCPCQPFSVAGKGLGTADERHLWPAFFNLIAECRPPVVFGEQVASKDALQWLDGVFTDLEGADYACGSADLCAAGVSAPHIRQRLFWGAYAHGEQAHTADAGGLHAELGSCGVASGLVFSNSTGREPGIPAPAPAGHGSPAESDGRSCGLGDAIQPGLEGQPRNGDHGHEPGRVGTLTAGSTATPSSAGHWDNFDILPCLDGKTRRVESGTFPLAHGVPGRVGLLRGYGNAIVPQVAAQFIQACGEGIA